MKHGSFLNNVHVLCLFYFIYFFTYFSYFNNDSKKPGFFFPPSWKGKWYLMTLSQGKHQGFIAVVYNKTLSSSCWTAEYFIYITYLFFYSVIFKLKLNDND